MEPEPSFLPGAGANWTGPRTSRAGATQKSGGSATLHLRIRITVIWVWLLNGKMMEIWMMLLLFYN